MKREKRYKVSEWSKFAILLLLALIVPSMAAAAAEEGTLTIKKFRVEDYANLRESTGQSSDIINVPNGAQTIADVTFQIEKLLVSDTDEHVAPSTPVDTSFPARSQRTDANGETVFTNLPEGYYLVTETIPEGHSALDGGKFVVSIPNKVVDANGNETTNYDVVVYPKGQSVQVEKTVSSAKQVVGVGDIITWDVLYPMGPDLKKDVTINGVTTTSYGKNFHLTDEMDSRLDYIPGSVEFTYYDRNKNEIGLTLVEGVDYELQYNQDTHILTIAFTDNVGTNKVADAYVAYIGMKLGTRVNASALDTIEVIWNNARISFENYAGDPYEHEVFPPGISSSNSRVPKVYLGQIVITKVDAQNKNERLAGATFYLADSRANAEAGNFLTREVDANGTREEITITTDQNGQASIRAIGAGTYYLVETQAPVGYRKLTEPVEVTVANDPRNNVANLEVSNIKDVINNTPEEPVNQGGKEFVGGVKTGDVVRMTGILLLTIASAGIVIAMVRRGKAKTETALQG